MDKLDRLGEAGVALLLGGGRRDESGDFTEGAGLADEDAATVLGFMRATRKSNAETCAALAALIGGTASGSKGVETLAAMSAQLSALGLKEDRARIDLSVVRGLEYYTGPVFEAELTAAVVDEKGKIVRLGSVASGGRYDDLVKRFKGVEVPAVGVSVGVSRLLAALEILRPKNASAAGPVVVLALDKDRMADYQAMAAELRAAGIRAEVYLGGAGMKAQIKYADKRGAPVAVIQGGDELSKGEVTIKDLVLGAKLAQDIEDNAEWRSGQPAQASVPRSMLVDAVKKALSRK
jgi:histidyl-tRNA synthetase